MSGFPDFPVRLEIASNPAHLPVVRAALERLCALLGFDESAAGDVVLAVDEALTNIIKHAYHGASDRPIQITFRPLGTQPGAAILQAQSPSAGKEPTTQPGAAVLQEVTAILGLEIRLRDWGEQAAPEKIRSRDLHDVRPGGLGVHIMRRCMDRVDYAHAAEGGTVLTMVKTRSCP